MIRHRPCAGPADCETIHRPGRRSWREDPMPRRLAALLLLTLLVAAAAAPAFAAARSNVLTVRPAAIDFHTKRVGTENYKRARITNTSGADVNLLVDGGLPDDFGFGLLPGSTCPVLGPELFPAGASCYIVVRFSPTEFFAGWHQVGSLQATATDPGTGTILETVSIGVF